MHVSFVGKTVLVTGAESVSDGPSRVSAPPPVALVDAGRFA